MIERVSRRIDREISSTDLVLKIAPLNWMYVTRQSTIR